MRYEITPVPAPRMTRADAWKQRPCVLRYRKFRDQVRAAGIKIPENGAIIDFLMPMPASWSQKKRDEQYLMPHKQKPDLDNLAKALFDAVFDDDCHVWSFTVRKYWYTDGAIEID